MAGLSKIEWTDATWNPVRGCSRCSPGCLHCYAERIAARFVAPGQPYEGLATMTAGGPRWTNVVRPVEDVLEAPLHWRSPRTVFVNSMSDLFHEQVPLAFIHRVFDVMRRAHWHRLQVLTKRADRCATLSPHVDWPANVWMGVSVETAAYLGRMDALRRTGAAIKFLSLEPLLGPLHELSLVGIDWVIVGGESGPGARPINPAWVVEIRDRCLLAGVPFFFKQWGGVNKKKAGRLLDGRTWDEMPPLQSDTQRGQSSNEALPSGADVASRSCSVAKSQELSHA